MNYLFFIVNKILLQSDFLHPYAYHSFTHSQSQLLNVKFTKSNFMTPYLMKI